jgi:hypothetical protein
MFAKAERIRARADGILWDHLTSLLSPERNHLCERDHHGE